MNAWNTGNQKTQSMTYASNSSSTEDIIRRSSNGLNSYLVAVGSRSSRFRRKHKEHIIIVILLVLITIFLIILIVISILYAKQKSKHLCETKQCIRSAANLLLSMDTSVDPCDDFYKYACGNWAKEHPKPDFSLSYDWFAEKQKKVERQIRDMLVENSTNDEPLPLVQAKNMHKACTNTEILNTLGMKPVIDFMKSVNLPPLPAFFNMTTGVDPENYNIDWLDIVIKVKKKMAFDVLIGFEIFPDTNNSTVKRLVFGEPSTTDLLPSYKDLDKILKKAKKEHFDKISLKRKYATQSENSDDEQDDDDSEEFMKVYKALMKEVVLDMIEDVDENVKLKLTQEQIETNLDSALNDYVEVYLKIFPSNSENDTIDDDDNNENLDGIVFYTVDEFQEAIDKQLMDSNLNKIEVFKPYLSSIFDGTGVKINFDNDLIMTSEYDVMRLESILTLAQNISCMKLEMFIWFQILENFIPHTTTYIRDVYDRYVMAITGVEGHVPRSVYCASTVTGMMGMAVGYAMVNKEEVQATLKKVERMLTNIKRAFEKIILSVTWMDLPTKRATIEKVWVMRQLIGFPKWFSKPGQLEEYYRGVQVDPETHLENLIGILRLGFFKKLENFREPYTFKWETIPTEVNAYHTFQANGITVPLVMLQYPFYDLGLEALNYAAIGTILGHEITHGFDNEGRKYDKDGILIQWWSNKTIDTYVNKTKCFVDQYANFYVPEVDKHVNGINTLGENIADNGGLKSALRAYKMEKQSEDTLPGLNHLNSDQLFFLSYGNLWCSIQTQKSLKYDLKEEHSPNHLRMKGTLQNSPEFAKAWNCPSNSTMNPSKKRCIIF